MKSVAVFWFSVVAVVFSGVFASATPLELHFDGTVGVVEGDAGFSIGEPMHYTWHVDLDRPASVAYNGVEVLSTDTSHISNVFFFSGYNYFYAELIEGTMNPVTQPGGRWTDFRVGWVDQSGDVFLASGDNMSAMTELSYEGDSPVENWSSGMGGDFYAQEGEMSFSYQAGLDNLDRGIGSGSLSLNGVTSAPEPGLAFLAQLLILGFVGTASLRPPKL